MWIHHGYTFIQFGSRFTDMLILWIKWEWYVVCVQMSQKYQNKYVINVKLWVIFTDWIGVRTKCL